MLYIVLIGALFCLTTKGFCGKKLSFFIRDTSDAFLFNFLRMLFCILIGIAMVFIDNAGAFLLLEGKMLAICALSGISNAAFLICWLLAVRKNSMVSIDVGLTLGSLIPSVLCMILFGEDMSVPKMIGFAFIIAATVILAGKSKDAPKNKSDFLGLLLLILAAAGEGISSFTQQLYKQYYTESGTLANGTFYPKTIFHFYTYVFAAIVLFLIFFGYRMALLKKEKSAEAADCGETKNKITVPPRAALHIFIMAVCLFAANYFQTVATNDYGMSSQMLYPIMKGGCLVSVNIIAMIFFGEKITKRSILGSLVALLGIVSMSIL